MIRKYRYERWKKKVQTRECTRSRRKRIHFWEGVIVLNCIWWMDAADTFEASVIVTEMGIADLGPLWEVCDEEAAEEAAH